MAVLFVHPDFYDGKRGHSGNGAKVIDNEGHDHIVYGGNRFIPTHDEDGILCGICPGTWYRSFVVV